MVVLRLLYAAEGFIVTDGRCSSELEVRGKLGSLILESGREAEYLRDECRRRMKQRGCSCFNNGRVMRLPPSGA